MEISPETLKVILIIVSAIVTIIVSVSSFYVISFIKETKNDKLKSERRTAMNFHKMNATHYALTTNNNGFNTEKFKTSFQQRLRELIDEDEIFKD